jgi:hypothetical protein
MSTIPKVVFIVPYRNREQHKVFFSNYIKTIMDESDLKDSYEVYFSHQCDKRPFNRGATKNIGFLVVKEKYPNDYKNITFVFNDIDTLPFSNLFDYETVKGNVKHFYGFNYALGGIVSLTGLDFLSINGFPNFWGWGMEDKILQNRCEKKGIKIDRSNFFSIGSPNILHLFDGIQRIINYKELRGSTRDNTNNGLLTIYNLKYNIHNETKNDKIFIINITNFMTETKYEEANYNKYDLRTSTKTISNLNQSHENKMDYVTNDWTNIPSTKYNNNAINNNAINNNTINNNVINNNAINNRNLNSSKYIIPENINKFSPDYARRIGVKPKATSSVNIRLGGLYN